MEEARASRVSVLADRVPGQWGIREVVKAFDHKNKEVVAIKIIKSKK